MIMLPVVSQNSISLHTLPAEQCTQSEIISYACEYRSRNCKPVAAPVAGFFFLQTVLRQSPSSVSEKIEETNIMLRSLFISIVKYEPFTNGNACSTTFYYMCASLSDCTFISKENNKHFILVNK